MFKVEAVKKITVTEQIMEQIANLITSRQIQGGDQLPNERDLAVQFNVTRGRVREALRALSLVGLITIKAGEGSFVNKQERPIPAETIVWLFHNEIHNLQEVYAARKLIESEVYLSASQQITDDEMGRLSEFLQTLVKSKSIKDPTKFLHLLDEIDLYIGEICGNQIYAKLMQTIVYMRRETSIKLLSVPGAIESSSKSRSSMLHALQSKDCELMQKATQAFFDNLQNFYKKIG